MERGGCKPRDMVAVIDAQRANTHECSHGLRPMRSIGGAVLELTVTAKGVGKRLIRQWNDPIGQAIAA